MKKKVGLQRSVSVYIEREFGALDEPNGRLVAITKDGERIRYATDISEATLAYLFHIPRCYRVTYSLAPKNGNIVIGRLRCAWPHGMKAFTSGCWNVCFIPYWWIARLDPGDTIRVNRKMEVIEE